MKITAAFCLAIATAFGAAIDRRAEIAHDAVKGFSQTVPSGTLGQLYLKYKPYLKVVNGCVPFPAVDASGNTGYVLINFTKPFIRLHILKWWPQPNRRLKQWLLKQLWPSLCSLCIIRRLVRHHVRGKYNFPLPPYYLF